VLQKVNRDVKSSSCAPIYAAILKRIEADAVVAQHFESRAAAISEDKERAGERIFRQLAFAKRGKPIDAVTEVDRLAGEEDS
jgi:hypothetical protein